MKPNETLAQILEPAYGPCPAFSGVCQEKMRWDPASGHVPRGFIGASGSLAEVELVLVVAEPGDPNHDETHTGLESAYDYAYEAFKRRRDLFHRNVRYILDLCWPELEFEKQMRKVWMTESVLCSARYEGGSVPADVCRECGSRYLLKQLDLVPNALVVALGGKARERLKKIGVEQFIPAWAVAPPGCNKPEARESWKQIPKALQQKRGKMAGA